METDTKNDRAFLIVCSLDYIEFFFLFFLLPVTKTLVTFFQMLTPQIQKSLGVKLLNFEKN